MPSKWEIINGVKYPVEDLETEVDGEEIVSLPRGYWSAIEDHKRRNEAAVMIQKFARRIYVYNTLEFPVDIYIGPEHTV